MICPAEWGCHQYLQICLYWLSLSLLICAVVAWGLWCVVCMHRGRDPWDALLSITPNALADAVCLLLDPLSALSHVLGTEEPCPTCRK